MYETIMKQYVKQKIKHKVKLYLTRVSVRQMRKQHSETKHLVKRRKKENRNNHPGTPAKCRNEMPRQHNETSH